MLEKELVQLVADIQQKRAEAQIVEVKSAEEGCPSKLCKTLSSFSNQDEGGTIVFGLNEKDQFQINGVYDLQDLQQKVTEQCKQMDPPIRAVFTSTILQGKKICAAEIPGIDYVKRPCYYTGVGRIQGSYIRVGDADLHMTDYEIYSYEAFRRHLHDDERSVERANFAMLDEEALAQYIRDKKRGKEGFARASQDTAFEMLNISRNGVPTLAAVLNFGYYPQGIFPQYAMTAVVVPGKEMGETDRNEVRFLDNLRIEGNLAEMVEAALTFCQRNMRKKTQFNQQTGERKDQWEYPLLAIREALVNAVIHRDYSAYTEGTPVQIELYEDRLEIHSPGTLYGRMTVDQLGKAKPDLRNPALAVMAENLIQAENRFSGIPTMRREMKRNHLPEPKFENRRNEFVVTFYNDLEETTGGKEKKQSTGSKKTQDEVLDFCESPRSRREIADFLGIKTIFYAMSRYIRPLLDSGALQMTIPEKPKSMRQMYVRTR